MSIQKISQNITTKIFTNKTVLKGLEKISDHSTSFTASTALFMSTVVRPAVIFSTPDVEKENKQYAMTNSISSGLVKFAFVESVALPLEYSIKEINENPQKFLTSKTIQTLKNTSGELLNSRSYKLLTQFMKLSTAFITAVPKSILTVALIPIFMDKLFKNRFEKKTVQTPQLSKQTGKDIEFKGLSKNVSKIINNEHLQKLAIKYQTKDKDIAFNTTVATDLLLTGTGAWQTYKSKKIKENRKKALIYNNLISTGITIGGGFAINNFVKNSTTGFVEQFKTLNKHDPKLLKYIEGINILRPALIFAGIYYGILPMISTYIAEKVDKFLTKK